MVAEVNEVKKVIEPKAAEVKAAVTEADTPAAPRVFVDTVHKVLLAGIGAVALAQEEVEEFVGRLVERGEIAEADGRKMMKDVLERRKKQAKKVEELLDKRAEELLARMNIPTTDELAALSARIAELTKKVDELKEKS
jgi:poly(hydroxyalkanoate) granule-associated protein